MPSVPVRPVPAFTLLANALRSWGWNGRDRHCEGQGRPVAFPLDRWGNSLTVWAALMIWERTGGSARPRQDRFGSFARPGHPWRPL